MTELAVRFRESLLAMDKVGAERLLAAAVVRSPAEPVLENIIVTALEDIGRGWEAGDYALAQVYMSGRICEDLAIRLLPPGSADFRPGPPLAIATLADHHLLGKRIVHSVLRAAGWGLTDYGRVEPGDLVAKLERDEIEIVLLSTLMLPSALRVTEVVDLIAHSGLPTKVVVGGAPFRLDPGLWHEVGASASGVSAVDAVAIVNDLAGSGSL